MFSIDFFEHVDGESMCFAGAPELETLEITLKQEISCFLCFVIVSKFNNKCENHEIQVLLALLYQ